MPRYDRLPVCLDERHGTPCPGPCATCRVEGCKPRNRVRCYDSGSRVADRYTVLFEDMSLDDGTLPQPYGVRQGLALSDDPGHPQGVSQWGLWPPQGAWGGLGSHTPHRIPFADLPAAVRTHVLRRLED